MGEKSEQKRLYILEKAKPVFAAKGFRAVTMKDIVEACDISRGGLYLYYGSTEEIFRDVLLAQLNSEDDTSLEGMHADATMAELLLLFLKEQKREILRKKNSITVAAYEYFFAHKPEKKGDNLLKNQFDTAQMVLCKILQEGVNRGEFYCEDCKAAAGNIMFTLEGMRVCARTMGLSEGRFDKELLYIIEGLVIDEEV